MLKKRNIIRFLKCLLLIRFSIVLNYISQIDDGKLYDDIGVESLNHKDWLILITCLRDLIGE